MHKHGQLMLFDPNLIIQLLQTNVNYNYFQFTDLIFQQQPWEQHFHQQ